MEHIVQFGIGIDDEGIRKRIEAAAEQQILREIELDAKRAIYERNPYRRDDFTNNPTSYFDEKITGFLETHKDEIIEMASKRLAERLVRLKKVKEMLEETVEAAKGES